MSRFNQRSSAIEVSYQRPDCPPAVRVSFPDSDAIEALLVTRLVDSTFRLYETPVFSEYASYGDVIEAEVASDGHLVCRRVVARSGLQTLCWIASGEFIRSQAWPIVQQRLIESGGNWEQVFGGILLLHIPKDSIADCDDIIQQARGDAGECAAEPAKRAFVRRAIAWCRGDWSSFCSSSRTLS